MLNLKKNKGITLIALIVTIIILLILAGISITNLGGDNGLISKVKQAQTESKKAEYMEKIKLHIYEEQMERYEIAKDEAFIISVKKRIEDNESKWAKQVTACDEYSRTDIADENKNLLIILTKEDYEIKVDVNNESMTAEVRNTFEKAETCKITYMANNGTSAKETQEARKGLSAIVKDNIYEKQYYSFAGWCENQDGTGTIYVSGSSIQVNEDKTLYAIWTRGTVVVSFDANGGTGSMEDVETSANVDIAYPVLSGISRNGYNLIGWNTKADGSGTNYAESQKDTVKITIGEENITLYARWQATTYSITYTLNGGSVSNPTSYTIETENFTLTNPSRSGYTFTGWSGTGISGTSTSVTIEKGSTGTRSYTANWQAITCTAGQEVTFKGEQFFVIKDDGDSVRLLAKYCVNSSTNTQYDKNATYSTYGRTFSSTNYWGGKSGVIYPCDLQTSERLGWIPSSDTVANNAIKCAQAYGASKEVEGRLMTYQEAYDIQNGSDSNMKNILWGKWTDGTEPTQGFLLMWIGAAYDEDSVWYDHGNMGVLFDCAAVHTMNGVRPVLVISKSLIE